MTVISRKDARNALAGYLSSTLTSAQKVYAYQVSDFSQEAPIVYITSSGSDRQLLTGRGFSNAFSLNVHTFVLYPSEHTGKNYNEQNAEDILDQLEAQIAQAVLDIRGHSIIKSIQYQEGSNADTTVEIGGETYLHEIIPLILTCY